MRATTDGPENTASMYSCRGYSIIILEALPSSNRVGRHAPGRLTNHRLNKPGLGAVKQETYPLDDDCQRQR